MKRWTVLLILFLTACGAGPQVYATAQPSQTALPTYTEAPTIQPTPTIGYQATAEIAQQTAEAAERLNVAVTAEAEQRIHQEMAWTAEADVRQQEVLGWTATAAVTSVGLTATQQAVLNTQIPAQQTLISVQIAATQGAPDLMIAVRNAQTVIDYWWVNPVAILILAFSAGCFLLACCWKIYKDDQRKREKEAQMFEGSQYQASAANEAPIIHLIDLDMKTAVEVKKNSGMQTARLIVPCSVDQLTELAEGLVSGKKTLAINQWEGARTQHFTRPIFLLVRNFLQTNKFVQSGGGMGSLVLTTEGEAFMLDWLNSHSLPSSYEFGPEAHDLQGESAHEHENHEHERVVGGLKTAVPMAARATIDQPVRRLI